MIVEGDWRRDGFVVIRQALRPDTLATLRVEAERCVARHMRWHGAGRPGHEDNPADSSDVHILRNLNRPCDGHDDGVGPASIGPARGSEGFHAVMETIADPELLATLREMFCAEPLFRGTALWINPLETSEEGRWHRDSQFMGLDETAERVALEDMAASGLAGSQGCQLQIALLPNSDVELVSGSHVRWDTPDERALRYGDADSTQNLPGSTRVDLAAGDAVAFSAWGVHRGRYHRSVH
jgi:hypothetical protein|eukprot:COSAG06_NODE_2015_length_7841_cov_33.158615_3_plen_239_part_00